MNLYDLAERPLARPTDPATSHAAATEIAPKLSDIRAWALSLLREHPGMTAVELCEAAGIGDVRKVNRRLPELERDGLVRRGEARVCRVTGKRAQPWFPV